MIRIDITGQKFNRLTVLEYSGQSGYGDSLWLCKCDCGNEKILRSSKIRKGTTKSCGCYKQENIKPRYDGHHPSWTGYEEISGSLWHRIRCTAKERNLEFNITKEYVWDLYLKQNRLCKLSGQPITFCTNQSSKNKQKSIEQSASLDRIDSSIGYVEGNVQWVHRDINYMKMNINQDKFLQWCQIISEYQKNLLLEDKPFK